MFDLAQKVECDYAFHDYAELNDEESWAVHLAEMMLARDAQLLDELCLKAPIRALALTEALAETLQNAVGQNRSAEHEMLELRVAHVRRLYRSVALDRLQEMLQDTRADSALRLLFYFRCADVPALQQMLEIDLGGEILSEVDLHLLEQAVDLQVLNLFGTAIGRKPFEGLRLPPSITELSVGATIVADLSGIDKCVNLRKLDLQRTNVEDMEMIKLTSLPLQELDLTHTRVTEYGVSLLKNKLPDCAVTI